MKNNIVMKTNFFILYIVVYFFKSIYIYIQGAVYRNLKSFDKATFTVQKGENVHDFKLGHC